MYRLARVAAGAFTTPLTALQWAALLGWTAFAAYAEGYRAFHKAFSPRVALRVYALAQGRFRRYAIVAPLFCMALVGATRRRMITSWSIVLMVVGLITLLRRVSQPTRGIVDAGVVVALTLGTLSVLLHTARAFAGKPPQMSGDFPDEVR